VAVRWDGTEQRPATVAIMIESVPGAVPAGTAGGAMESSLLVSRYRYPVTVC
jgi:hypothetical protein